MRSDERASPQNPSHPGVQQQLYRIEEWKLADLERSLERLEASQRDVIGALNEDDALQGLFIDAMARRLRSLGEEASRVGQQRDEQSARLLEHGARKVCAERLAEAVDRQVAQAADKISSSTSSSASSAPPHKPPARLPSDGVGERDGGSRPVAGTPPSDIVLGVALAADPQKYRAAAERLRSLSAAAGAKLDASAWQASVVPATEAVEANAVSPTAVRATSGRPGKRAARPTPSASSRPW